MVNPLDGHVVWPVPDNHSISVTLFKDPRTHEMEDKDWTFVLEDVSTIFSFKLEGLRVLFKSLTLHTGCVKVIAPC